MIGGQKIVRYGYVIVCYNNLLLITWIFPMIIVLNVYLFFRRIQMILNENMEDLSLFTCQINISGVQQLICLPFTNHFKTNYLVKDQNVFLKTIVRITKLMMMKEMQIVLKFKIKYKTTKYQVLPKNSLFRDRRENWGNKETSMIH